MNNFNEGDKILCKKDLIANYSTHFIECKYYIYHKILNDSFKGFACCIFNESNGIYPYFLNKNELLNHFYTKQEERKIKLEKLYEETES